MTRRRRKRNRRKVVPVDKALQRHSDRGGGSVFRSQRPNRTRRARLRR